jgi:hypothetical protein
MTQNGFNKIGILNVCSFGFRSLLWAFRFLCRHFSDLPQLSAAIRLNSMYLAASRLHVQRFAVVISTMMYSMTN